MNEKRRYTAIDLFAGCGGLSLGLEQAGFFPVLVNELNKDAMETYLINRDKINPLLRKKYNVNDVKELVVNENKLEELCNSMRQDYGINIASGELDLLCGGPPCQGFSGIGHRRLYSVEKKQLPSNQLFQDMAFLVNKLRPRIFLFENVRGLLNSRWTYKGEAGEIWEDVKRTFKAIPGYNVRWNLIHAKDYGVPQNRPRVLLVGVREDVKAVLKDGESAIESGLLPEPTNDYPDLKDLLGDLVDPRYQNGGVTLKYPHEALTKVQKQLRTYSGNKYYAKGDTLTEQEYSNHSPDIVRKFKYMLKHNGDITKSMKTKKFAQRLLPKKWDKKGPSITATSLSDDYVHYSQPRVLTVREWARLQMFPDWYVFSGKRTTGGIRRAGNPRKGIHDREVPKYTQIGNAVPVKLAYEVGKNFIKLIGA